MIRPELDRRVDRLEEDLQAISDTALDIKETVDRHTETLTAHGRELVEIRGTLVDHGRELTEIRGTLVDHGRQLDEILTLLRRGR